MKTQFIETVPLVRSLRALQTKAPCASQGRMRMREWLCGMMERELRRRAMEAQARE